MSDHHAFKAPSCLVGGVLLASFAIAACAGKSQSDAASSLAGSGAASSAGANGGGASGGKAGSSGSAGNSGAGSSGAASTAGASGAGCDGAAPYVCVESCSEPYARFVAEAVCQDGAWTCLGVLVDESKCPPHSCVLQDRVCCDRLTGALSTAVCGADGLLEACAANQKPYVNACAPDGVSEDCAKLQGKPCTLSGQQCVSNTYDGVCSCFASDGGLVWSCVVNLH